MTDDTDLQPVVAAEFLALADLLGSAAYVQTQPRGPNFKKDFWQAEVTKMIKFFGAPIDAVEAADIDDEALAAFHRLCPMRRHRRPSRPRARARSSGSSTFRRVARCHICGCGAKKLCRSG